MDKNVKDKKPSVPDLSGGPGWSEIELPVSYGQGTSFLHGSEDSDRLRFRYFRNETDHSFMARVWFGPATEGPPGHAHGGSLAAVLDEAMGFAVWLAGHKAVSARIAVDYLKMLPLGTVTIVEARVEKARGRKITTKGMIRDTNGTVFTKAQGLFIAIDPARFGQLSNLRFPQEMGKSDDSRK